GQEFYDATNGTESAEAKLFPEPLRRSRMIHCRVVERSSTAGELVGQIDNTTGWLVGRIQGPIKLDGRPGVGYFSNNLIIDCDSKSTLVGFELMCASKRHQIGERPIIAAQSGIRSLVIVDADHDERDAILITDAAYSFVRVLLVPTATVGTWYYVSRSVLARVNADGTWEEILVLPAAPATALLNPLSR
ncbi:MAG: hypothetical protein M3N19_06540, partial [Candidatus Eremiobacteraeota bacterium]|nr:hypothetical protein [Candidatus Eremiobacteraeota bacterium]